MKGWREEARYCGVPETRGLGHLIIIVRKNVRSF